MHAICTPLMLRQEGEGPTRVSHITLQIWINMKLMEQEALRRCSTKPAEFMRKGIQTNPEATRQPTRHFVCPLDHQAALLQVCVCCRWVIELHCCHGVTHQRLIIPAAARGGGNNISHVQVWSLEMQCTWIWTWGNISGTCQEESGSLVINDAFAHG